MARGERGKARGRRESESESNASLLAWTSEHNAACPVSRSPALSPSPSSYSFFWLDTQLLKDKLGGSCWGSG